MPSKDKSECYGKDSIPFVGKNEVVNIGSSGVAKKHKRQSNTRVARKLILDEPESDVANVTYSVKGGDRVERIGQNGIRVYFPRGGTITALGITYTYRPETEPVVFMNGVHKSGPVPDYAD